MIRTSHASVLTGTLAVLLSSPLVSQSPPAPVFSIGQPPIWRQHIAVQGTAHRTSSNATDATLTYGLKDLFYMMARTTWVEREAELNKLLPRRTRLIHWFAHRIRATL